MALCNLNLTYGISVAGQYSIVKENRLAGHMGKYYDGIYVHKNQRSCSFKGLESKDLKNKNSFRFIRKQYDWCLC